MPRFADIFHSQSGDHQSEMRTLNELAQAAGWTVLQPQESIHLHDDSRAIVISGVTWSKPDLEVLDELASHDTAGTRVWFFNPDCVFPDERILPGARPMIQTPVLAEYSGTRLVSFVQGGSVSEGVIERIRILFPLRSTQPSGSIVGQAD